jgi:hypothetical protein
MSNCSLSGHVGAREDQLPSAQQEDRAPRQIPQGRCGKWDEVDSADIIKGYEVGKGDYIELDPEELEAVAIESKRTIDIDEFVPRAEIDELYLNNPYYIAPDGEVGVQAFAVIREAIRKEGMVAIGKVVFTSLIATMDVPEIGPDMAGSDQGSWASGNLRYPRSGAARRVPSHRCLRAHSDLPPRKRTTARLTGLWAAFPLASGPTINAADLP